MTALVLLLGLALGAPDAPAPPPHAEAARRLVRDLGAESWEVRERAYRALRALAEEARPYLEEALEGEDLEVRRAASRLLLELGASDRRDVRQGLRDRSPDFRETEAYAELLARGADAIPVLLGAIRREDDSYPQYDFYTLRNANLLLQDLAAAGHLGRPDVPDLLGLLDSPNIQARLLGGPVLRQILGDDLLPVLEAALRTSKAPRQRAQLLELLGDIDSERALPLLPAALTDEEPSVRLAAANLMMRRSSPDHLPLLLRAAADPDPAVRSAVLQALVRHAGDREAQVAVRAALQDPDEDVRRTALSVVAQTARRANDPSVIPFVRPFLRDSDPSVVQAAASLLGQLRDCDATPLLLAALTRGDEMFRMQTGPSLLQALGQIADPAAREPLEKLLDDETLRHDPRFRSIRVYAIQALARLVGKEALPRVAEALDEDDSFAPQMLLPTLLEISAPERIPLLRRMLDHENRFVVARAATGLGQAGDRDSAPRLVALLSTDDAFLRQSLLEALVTLASEETCPPLLALLEGLVQADGGASNSYHARLILQALGTARYAPASRLLVTLVRKHGTLAVDAAEALARTGGDGAREAVADLLSATGTDSTSERRLTAALALLGDEGRLRRLHETDEAVLDEERPDPLALGRAADSAARLGLRERAVALARRRVEIAPDDPAAHYDLSRVLALGGEPDEALRELARAEARGYRGAQRCLQDPDLESLRDRPAFRETLARMNR